MLGRSLLATETEIKNCVLDDVVFLSKLIAVGGE